MQNRDWEQLGENIRRTVQDAIDSQDFERLNQTISNTINDTVGSVCSGIKNASKNVSENVSKNMTQNMQQKATGNTQKAANASNQYQNQTQVRAGSQNSNLYARTTGTKAGGIVMTVLGIVFGSTSTVAVLAILIVTLVMGAFPGGAIFATICMGILLVTSGVLLGKGLTKLGKTKRFSLYLDEVRAAGYCDIKRLCEVTGKSSKKVVKDLNDMIERRWFKEGHLDEQQTCLITSHQLYDEYQTMMQARRENEEAERIKKEQEAKQAESMAPEVREILKAGEEYISKIHACNDAIPGIEISQKIARMEELVDRIFDRVEQDPSSVGGIHKMMDYYLPTTVKLLEAYEDLDSQPIQGENIISSKQEIEKTLDTLNSAFEKLLDDLFEKTAWDVSSDISVLNTLLAQEGLKDDGFQ